MPKAQRMSFSRWKDPRLSVGILLIAASAIAGGFLMREPDTRPVYQAASPVLPGTQVGHADLRIVEVPAHVARSYVGPADGFDDRLIMQVVGEGEFISERTMEPDHENASYTHLVVPLIAPAPSGLDTGSHGELWKISQEDSGGEESGAERIANDLVIVSIASPDSMRIDQYSAELQVPNEDVPDVLSVLGSHDGLVLAQGGGQ